MDEGIDATVARILAAFSDQRGGSREASFGIRVFLLARNGRFDMDVAVVTATSFQFNHKWTTSFAGLDDVAGSLTYGSPIFVVSRWNADGQITRREINQLVRAYRRNAYANWMVIRVVTY